MAEIKWINLATGGVVGVVDVATDFIDEAITVEVEGVKKPLSTQIYSSKNIIRAAEFFGGLAATALNFMPEVAEPLYTASEPLFIRTIADIIKKLIAPKEGLEPGRVRITRVERAHWRPAGVPPEAISPLRFT